MSRRRMWLAMRPSRRRSSACNRGNDITLWRRNEQSFCAAKVLGRSMSQSDCDLSPEARKDRSSPKTRHWAGRRRGLPHRSDYRRDRNGYGLTVRAPQGSLHSTSAARPACDRAWRRRARSMRCARRRAPLGIVMPRDLAASYFTTTVVRPIPACRDLPRPRSSVGNSRTISPHRTESGSFEPWIR